MKKIFRLGITLFVLISLSIFLLINCGNPKINDSREKSDFSFEEKISLSKSKQHERDCYGMAVKWTGLKQYPTNLGYVPDKEFSKTSYPSKAIIIEWDGERQGDHAAKIKTYDSYNGAVDVREFVRIWSPQIQDNTYYPPYNHPVVDNNFVVYWWKRDPPPLKLDISGPTEIHTGEYGPFYAVPEGGAGTYNNYRWWKRNDENMKGKKGIKAPPPGEWIELEEWEGKQRIEQTAHHDFSLKCKVYDAWGKTAEDIHSVRYIYK